MTPEPDKIVGGKYRLEKPLAKGGMGSVWIARHTELDSPVAVKFMAHELVGTPVAEARFKREAKAAAQLRSPNVVSIQDYGVQDGAPYMVMELLDGEDLSGLLGRAGRLSIARVAVIVGQVAKALALAHAAGIVHRDLKPSNLFLSRSGEDEVVKVLDFGIAKDTRSMLVVDKTTSGVLVGSPMYMSPEQARGEAIDFRSDLWSLGVVVYEALVGRPPFVSDHLGALLARIHEARVEPPTSIAPDLPAAIDAYVARALARQQEARFPSARAMADELAAIAQAQAPAIAHTLAPAIAHTLAPAIAHSLAPAIAHTLAPAIAHTLAPAHASTKHAAPEIEAARAPLTEPPPVERIVVIGRNQDTLPANEADPVSTTMHDRPPPPPAGASGRPRWVVPATIGAFVAGALAVGWFGFGVGQDITPSAEPGGQSVSPGSSAPGRATAAASATIDAPPRATASSPIVEPAPGSTAPTGAPATNGAAPLAPSATSTAREAPTTTATGKPRTGPTGATPATAAPVKSAAPVATAAPAATTAAPAATTAGPAYDPTFGLPSKTP